MNLKLLLAAMATTGSLGTALANNFVTGSSTNVDVTVNSATNWTTIRSATITIPSSDDAPHGCVVTASADVQNPGPAGRENQYRFALSLNDSSPVTDTGSERMLELVDNPGAFDDPDSKPVATTQTFRTLGRSNGIGGTGTHTFYFLGRKVQEGDSDTKVLDVSLTVICIHTQ